MVARPVVAGDAGPVDAEDHRQAVQAHVVVDLVPGPVEEGRVDGHHRPQATHGHAGGRGDRVLLGDADVEEAVGIAVAERSSPVGPGHGRGDGDHLGPRLGLGQQGGG